MYSTRTPPKAQSFDWFHFTQVMFILLDPTSTKSSMFHITPFQQWRCSIYFQIRVHMYKDVEIYRPIFQLKQNVQSFHSRCLC